MAHGSTPGLDVDGTGGRGLARRVAATSIAASVLLATLNVAVGLHARSTSVVATGFEFAGDVLASTIVLLGIIVAARPADPNHPYGHGRIETLAAFLVGLILMAGGAGISWNSLQAVADRHAPPSAEAITVLLVAIGVRGVMSVTKFKVGRRIGSASLVADAWNDTVDILAASVALTAVALSIHDEERFRVADHYGGFAVGLIVVVTGMRVLREATLALMDTMPADSQIARLRATAAGVPGVAGVDKTFARKTGFQYHVDIHIEVDPLLTVAASHEIAGQVRRVVRAELEWVADVLVHVEPAPSPGGPPPAAGA
jgi:cation diffusion facilitator family transporter